MPLPIVVDATPLGNAHAARGTGTAVRGLLEGFRALPPDARPTLAIAADSAAPAGFEVVRLRGGRRGDPGVIEAARGSSFHATQPSVVPDAPWVVATCFDLIPLRMPAVYLAGPRRIRERRVYRRYLDRLRRVGAVVVPSEATAADLVEFARVDRRRIHVVPLAASPSVAPEGPTPSGDYVLYCGSVEPHKNLAVVIEAIARTHDTTRLVVVGPWSRRRVERLQRHARMVGATERIDWMGFVPPAQLAAIRAGARAVLVPSLIEGFGLPVLEAMAAGVPVVASDIPSLREVAGDAADLIAPRDADAWAGAIDVAVGDPEHRAMRSREGRDRAALFTWQRTAEGVIAAHDGVERA
jgi:glycosyltransferase involved in cell wall biosynthesis